MNGSPSAILTMGLGSWGSVGLILTLGYGIGAAAVAIPGRLEYTIPAGMLQFTVPNMRTQYTIPDERLQFTAREG